MKLAKPSGPRPNRIGPEQFGRFGNLFKYPPSPRIDCRFHSVRRNMSKSRENAGLIRVLRLYVCTYMYHMISIAECLIGTELNISGALYVWRGFSPIHSRQNDHWSFETKDLRVPVQLDGGETLLTTGHLAGTKSYRWLRV